MRTVGLPYGDKAATPLGPTTRFLGRTVDVRRRRVGVPADKIARMREAVNGALRGLGPDWPSIRG